MMAELKGKFIALACNFLHTKPVARQTAIASVRSMTGKDPTELDPEEYYDTKVLDSVFQAVLNSESETVARAALKVIGQEVYYEIKWTVGLPDSLDSPLDYVKFEMEGFRLNHRGPDVVQRRILQAEDGHVIIEAPSPGYNCIWIEGVFEGILRMCGKVRTGRVVQTQCVMKGDPTCVYDIKW
jgi:predicted hydrocarbon binding protein